MTTQEDSARIIAAINERVPNQTCPFCGTKKFTLAEGMVQFELVPFHPPIRLNAIPGLASGNPVLPSVVLICQNCGNTILLNLVVLGLADLMDSPRVVPLTAAIKASGTLTAEAVVSQPKDSTPGQSGKASDAVEFQDRAH